MIWKLNKKLATSIHHVDKILLKEKWRLIDMILTSTILTSGLSWLLLFVNIGWFFMLFTLLASWLIVSDIFHYQQRTKPWSILKGKLQELINTNETLQEWIINSDSLDIILHKIKNIYDFLYTLKTSNRIRKNSVDHRLISNDLLSEQLSYFFIILTDLRSDLTLRLKEQQKVLEGARSEVEANIWWTKWLEEVSELQKVRLDKQIEQFEELQRVLVKV